MSEDFNALIEYGKLFTDFTPKHEQCLREIAPVVIPHLESVTHAFYDQLLKIPETGKFLEGRVTELKNVHFNWLKSLFESEIDAQFAEKMHDVGYLHVSIELPIGFMAGAMTLINNGLSEIVVKEFSEDKERCVLALHSISSVTGLALMLMQQAYQLWD